MPRQRSDPKDIETSAVSNVLRENLQVCRDKVVSPVFRPAWVVLLMGLIASFTAWCSVAGSLDYGPGWLVLFAGISCTVLLAGLVASSSLRRALSMEARQQQASLTAELTHRIKNNLAVVQSIARRTLKDERSVGEAREILIGRLRTLDNVQTSLIENSWEWVLLRDLAVNELQPFLTRVSMSGPPVRLKASPAQLFALAVHELATNASKFGALSAPNGHVEMRWSIDGGDGRESLSFDWKETGGPEVSPPMTKGFGRTILHQSLVPGAIRQPELLYEADGLRYVFEVPLAALCDKPAELKVTP
ncbi:MAG: sensor histidine kinase [Alphaproteobacteria bacterium]|nr:sensor histidine kinase [Alphaproteobacteria bacterium]